MIEEIITYRCSLCGKKHGTRVEAQACVDKHVLPVSVTVYTDGTSYVSECVVPVAVQVTMANGEIFTYRLEGLY